MATEERDITAHERLAMAIALDYGSVLAICEDEVESGLKNYTVEVMIISLKLMLLYRGIQKTILLKPL